MPDDLLITNLRDLANAEHSDMTVADEAADEILRLREQIARAREMIADVDRYDCEYNSSFHDSSMEKRPDGDWVRSEDYDALASKHVGLHALIDDVEAQRDSYALKLDEVDKARSEDARAFEKRLEDAYARNRTVTAERDAALLRLGAVWSLLKKPGLTEIGVVQELLTLFEQIPTDELRAMTGRAVETTDECNDHEMPADEHGECIVCRESAAVETHVTNNAADDCGCPPGHEVRCEITGCRRAAYNGSTTA